MCEPPTQQRAWTAFLLLWILLLRRRPALACCHLCRVSYGLAWCALWIWTEGLSNRKSRHALCKPKRAIYPHARPIKSGRRAVLRHPDRSLRGNRPPPFSSSRTAQPPPPPNRTVSHPLAWLGSQRQFSSRGPGLCGPNGRPKIMHAPWPVPDPTWTAGPVVPALTLSPEEPWTTNDWERARSARCGALARLRGWFFWPFLPAAWRPGGGPKAAAGDKSSQGQAFRGLDRAVVRSCGVLVAPGSGPRPLLIIRWLANGAAVASSSSCSRPRCSRSATKAPCARPGARSRAQDRPMEWTERTFGGVGMARAAFGAGRQISGHALVWVSPPPTYPHKAPGGAYGRPDWSPRATGSHQPPIGSASGID